ncbi:MAG: alpha/beta hydrolase [Hymenobacter sp.]|nr:MAG: alpha/beta hydrolase [Hymenobacter sp.]
MSRFIMLGALSLLASSCLRPHHPIYPVMAQSLTDLPLQITTFELVDSSRHRRIPVVTYSAAPTGHPPRERKLALLNHGYGGQNTAYQFVARNLVAHGYYVVSIQQDLPTDEPMPLTGNIYQTRYPFWERGVQNMLFTRQAIYRRNPVLKRRPLLLVGHSNGGDMVMLFAKEHPELVEKVISLDNRRVPFPRQRRPQVLSLRSSDQVADPGVVPTPDEQARLGTLVVALPATIHNDMWDGATELQRQEMNQWISCFLEQ